MREGGVRSIKDLLEKYRRSIRAPQGSVVRVFEKAARDLGVAIDSAHITYNPSTRTIIVSVSGPHKSEILLRKKELLAACERELGSQGAPKHLV